MSTPGYVAGDFWRICDACGFQKRASETFKRWDGLMVCAEDWEPRHPQDFVRGRTDRQTVPNPRPEPLATYVGPLSTTIATAASAGATTITVASTARFFTTDRLGIMMDSGSVYTAVIQEVSDATTIVLATALPGAAAAGNIVTNYSVVSEPSL